MDDPTIESDRPGDIVPKENESIVQLREKLRTKLRISRQEHRHKGTDTVRIAIGESFTENLRTYAEDDVQRLAKTIKNKKRANPHQLNQLAHAFLQTNENIQCFLNVTGALNVVVKEFTGTRNDTQLLAAECICNLSLGSEVACEKLALNVATYLITFLKSSNERLLQTSLWTITNLAASGNKSMKVLVDQEMVKSVASVYGSSLNAEIRHDALEVIDVAVDTNALRQEDIQFLLEWIPNSMTPSILPFTATKILYKLLNKLNFQWSQDVLVPIFAISTETVFDLIRNVESPTTDDTSKSHAIILMRIIGNLLAVGEWTANFLIEKAFVARQVEIVQFFKDSLRIADSEASRMEILWVVRNLLENKWLNGQSKQYIEYSGLSLNLLWGIVNEMNQ